MQKPDMRKRVNKLADTKPAEKMLKFMAQTAYADWYKKDVAPNLTKEQKDAVMRRVSDLTLESAIWMDRETNHIEQFPELKPHSHSGTISGLQLCVVMQEIFKELMPEQAKTIGELPFDW